MGRISEDVKVQTHYFQKQQEEKKTCFLFHGFLGEPSDWNLVYKYLPQNIKDQIEWNSIDYIPLISGQNTEFSLKDTKQKKITSLPEGGKILADNLLRPNQKATLIGYSMGGRVAFHTALAAPPNSVSQLILISTHPGLRNSCEKEQRKEADLKWYYRFLSEPFDRVWADWNLQKVFSLPLKIENSEQKIVVSNFSDKFDLSETIKVSGTTKVSEKNISREKLESSLIGLRDWSLSTQEFLLDNKNLKTFSITWFAGEYDEKYCQLLKEIEQHAFQYQLPIQTKVISNSSHRILIDQPQELARFLFSL